MKKNLNRLIVKGGVLSPGELKYICETAEMLGLETISFGSRQDVVFSKQVSEENIKKSLEISDEVFESILTNYHAIPANDLEKAFVELLAKEAALVSAHRHAGGFRDLFANGGKKTLAEGKDLTSIKYIIGTGGALTRLPNRVEILESIARSNIGDKLLPNTEAKILIDNDYIMASLGVLSKENKKAALLLLKKSLRIK